MPRLDINTLSGYEGANQLMTSGKLSLEEMGKLASTGQGLDALSQGSTPGMAVGGDTAALNPENIGANTYDAGNQGTEAFGNVPQQQPMGQPAIDLSGGDTGFGGVQDGAQSLNAGNNVGLNSGNPTDYTWDEKGFLGGKTGMGINADVGQTPIGEAGRNMGSSAGWNFNQPQNFGEKAMGTLQDIFKGGNNSIGMKAAKGIGGYLDYRQAGKAQDEMRAMYDRAMAGSDQFANERAQASAKWIEGVANPDALWNNYMQGQGGIDLENAAAKYAKAGRRNMLPQLTSQAKQQFMANAYPSMMQMYNPKQFAGNQGQVASQFAPMMADMTRNKYAPISKGIQDVFGSPSYDMSSLAKLFGR
jgi:hypothetical protein